MQWVKECRYDEVVYDEWITDYTFVIVHVMNARTKIDARWPHELALDGRLNIGLFHIHDGLSQTDDDAICIIMWMTGHLKCIFEL